MPRDPLPPGNAAPHGTALPPDLAADADHTDAPRLRPVQEPEPQSGPVECVLTLYMLFDADRVAAVPTRFSYDPAEPFAVRLAFHAGEYDEAEWVFARELLADGLRGPSGEGDIRLWPSHCPQHGGVLRITLDSPHGSAVLEAVAAEVAQWLERTHAAVPPGGELSLLPTDEELARLTAG
ncbi:SsgA family sporulation/cell division regulator [Peterkaempfera griseoplana]|uniref:SsgA family sporulation/cell division regulator n=1 Tax=Peterkaempfera griseoplana TaxID=66896 RepID=UPI0006E32CF1|nr:SsgA family sporulation/cell division regulator [Peterkaempfera griseoplana]